jgi:hypothetical protein
VNLARCQRYFYKIESSGQDLITILQLALLMELLGFKVIKNGSFNESNTITVSYDIGANGLVLYNNVDNVTASVPKVYALILLVV